MSWDRAKTLFTCKCASLKRPCSERQSKPFELLKSFSKRTFTMPSFILSSLEPCERFQSKISLVVLMFVVETVSVQVLHRFCSTICLRAALREMHQDFWWGNYFSMHFLFPLIEFVNCEFHLKDNFRFNTVF